MTQTEFYAELELEATEEREGITLPEDDEDAEEPKLEEDAD